MQSVPAITGRELIKLLQVDGWKPVRITNHRTFLQKDSRTTVIKNTRKSLPSGTLGAILGPKQTGLGKAGLRELLERYR